jgi:hypothetical protein
MVNLCNAVCNVVGTALNVYSTGSCLVPVAAERNQCGTAQGGGVGGEVGIGHVLFSFPNEVDGDLPKFSHHANKFIVVDLDRAVCMVHPWLRRCHGGVKKQQ